LFNFFAFYHYFTFHFTEIARKPNKKFDLIPDSAQRIAQLFANNLSLLLDFFDIVSFVVSAQATLHAYAHPVAGTANMSDFVLSMLLAMKKLSAFYSSASKFQFFYQIQVFFVQKREVFIQKVIRFQNFASNCCLRLVKFIIFGL
jgi:hypothetical protein